MTFPNKKREAKPEGTSSISQLPSSSEGFLLYEVILALIIFSLAMVSLATAVSRTISTGSKLNRDQHIRTHLEALLNEVRQEEDISAMSTQRTDERLNVTFQTTVEDLALENYNGDPLEDLFRLTGTATWQEGTDTLTETASLTLYQPQ